MQKSLASLAMLLGASLILSSCLSSPASQGVDPWKEKLKQVEKKKTTEAEILALFGPPTSERETYGGKEFFYKSKERASSGDLLSRLTGLSREKLIIWLDRWGRVSSYSYKE